ncbi:MAG: flagellar export chaperone FliS [Gammaproteobacteria bacterium]|nr:MAG: flagellar export chaperone FliS [Gammaproteobacteria bacterium]
MTYALAHSALKQYQQVGMESAVVYANPHRLAQILFENALDSIAAAKRHVGQAKMAKKAECITRALNIVEGLRLNLDLERGGQVAANLDSLYEYVGMRLLHANIKNDTRILDEVASLLGEIKSGWDAIAGHADGTAANESAMSPRVPMVG